MRTAERWFPVYHLALCWAGMLLYCLNRWFWRGTQEGALGLLLDGYWSDLLLGLILPAFANFLFFFVGKGIRKLWQILLLLLCCGIFWELCGPLVKEGSTRDPLDIVAYLLGGVGYFLLLQIYEKRKKVPEA